MKKKEAKRKRYTALLLYFSLRMLGSGFVDLTEAVNSNVKEHNERFLRNAKISKYYANLSVRFHFQ